MNPTTALIFNFILSLIDRIGSLGTLLTRSQSGTPITDEDMDAAMSEVDSSIEKLKAEIAAQRASPDAMPGQTKT